VNLSTCRAHHPGDLYALDNFGPASCGQSLACAACRRHGPACDVVLEVVVRTNAERVDPDPAYRRHIGLSVMKGGLDYSR